MSRCATTPSLLDARFAEVDLTRDQAAHVAACAECARAFALLRRFDAELRLVGSELAAEPAPAPPGMPTLTSMEGGGRPLTTPRNLAGALVALIAATFIVFAGGRWLASVVPFESIVGAPPVPPAYVASLVGVPQDEVLVTEDGALAIRDRGLILDLVMVRQSADGPVAKVVGSTPAGAEQVLFGTVTCAEDDELQRTDYVWGRWDGLSEVTGPGKFVIGDSGRLIFAYDRSEAAEGESLVIIEAPPSEGITFGPGGQEDDLRGTMDFGPAGEFIQRPCLERDFDPTAEPIQPERLRCQDWPALADDVRQAVTDWLIDEPMLLTIRDTQGLPADSGDHQVIGAAAGSIDKWCQDPALRLHLLSNVLRNGYGLSD